MKLLIRSFAVLAVLSVFASHSEARGRRPRLKPKALIPYTAIASVDAGSITTEPMNSTATGTKIYQLSAKTKVTVNGQTATLADLKPGMQVRVGAGMDAGIAEEISATPAPPKAK